MAVKVICFTKSMREISAVFNVTLKVVRWAIDCLEQLSVIACLQRKNVMYCCCCIPTIYLYWYDGKMYLLLGDSGSFRSWCVVFHSKSMFFLFVFALMLTLLPSISFSFWTCVCYETRFHGASCLTALLLLQTPRQFGVNIFLECASVRKLSMQCAYCRH